MFIVEFQLWNAVSEASLGVYVGHSGWVHSVAFSQDACKLVTSSDDETVKVLLKDMLVMSKLFS